VRTEEARVGARVKVRPGYRKPQLRGAVGTIAKVWGAPNYAAVEVRFDGGRSELLWRHELEEIREEAEGTLSLGFVGGESPPLYLPQRESGS
jgi:hypothetical protein